ncbi:MAG: hypothetical protein ABEJ79_04400 [Halolamina sp.]
MSDSLADARAAVRADHADVLAGVVAVATDLDAEWRDGRALAAAMRSGLEEAGLLTAAPSLLETATAAVGESTPAPPVAKPPYVIVTATGLVCRATLSDGRLVVRVEPFAVRRGQSRGESRASGPPRYVRVAEAPAAALSVELVADPSRRSNDRSAV